ncbi:coiled-coil domain-containing protein 154 isoform X5 [Lemur catta]|uniref:coiled-coil domain-containing protein 154 isoform X5 n=1 Tax=Lemur catta TaxID=9447 RepID=UPI001E266F79|nr:coiled-coil domain-containing protein 154 isoform X5 [Lemur catta]
MRPATWRPPPLSPSRTVPSTGSSWSSGCPRCRRRWPACGGRRSAASTPRWACCGSCCRCGPSCGCRTRSCSGCSRRCSGRLPPLRRRRQSPLAPRARTRCRPWTKGTSTYALKHSLGGRGGIGLPEGSGRRQSPFPGGLSCSVSNTRVWAPQRGLGLTAPRQPMVGTQWEAGSRSPPGGTPSPQRLPRELWACRKRPLCARLVEVREALRQVRRQTLQDSERKDAEQEMALRWALGTALGRHLVVIGTASRTSPALAELLAAGTPVGKVTPAWPCPFPSSSPSACARAGPCASRLASREVVPGPRGIKVQWPPSLPVAPQPGPATRSQCPQGGQADRLAEAGGAEPGGSLQRPAEGPGGRQPAGGPRGGQDAGPGDHARRGDEPSLPEEGGQAVRLPSEELPGPGEEDEGGGELAAAAGGPPAGGAGGPLGGAAGADGGAAAGPVRAVQGGARPAGGRPPPGAVPGPGRGCGPADQVRAAEPGVAEPRPAGRAEGSLREKSQVLEASVAQLAAQLKDLSDQFLTLSCRLDLQGQVLGLRLSEAKTEWEGAERKSLEDLARWQKEVAVQLQGLWEKVDGLPRQIEGVSDKCVLHKSDSDIRISAEGRARESEVGALRRELAALLSAVQLLKEDNPGRKIAEMQGRMATFQNQIIKLENSIQANRTIQNLQFNTETKLIREISPRVCRAGCGDGPLCPVSPARAEDGSPAGQRPPVGRGGALGAGAGQPQGTHVPGEAAVLRQGRGPRRGPREPLGRVPGHEVAAVEGDAPEPGGPVEAGRGPAAAPQRSLRGASRLCSSHRNKRALTCRAGP